MMNSPNQRPRIAYSDTSFAAHAGSPLLIDTEALIGALPSPVAVLNGRGEIVAASEAWRRSACESCESTLVACGVGQNYLESCRRTSGPRAKDAHEVSVGIQAILDGERSLFTFEYGYPIPDRPPDQQRWVLLQASSVHNGMQGVVIELTDITARKHAEAERQPVWQSDKSPPSVAAQQRAASVAVCARAEDCAHKVDTALDALGGRLYVRDANGPALSSNRALHEITGGVTALHDVVMRLPSGSSGTKSWEPLLAIVRALGAAPDDNDGTSLESGVFLSRLVELARDALTCQHVSILALEPETEHLLPVAQVGRFARSLPSRAAIANASTLSDLVPDELVGRLRSGGVVVQGRARELMVAPLLVGAKLVGVMVADYGERRYNCAAFELDLAAAIGQVAAIGLEWHRLLGERAEACSRERAAGEAAHSLELFIAMASHELRTPLTVVKSYLRGAEQHMATSLATAEDPPDGGQVPTLVQHAIQNARQAALQMGYLLDDLLQVSRARAGKVIVHPQRCDLSDLIRQVVHQQHQLQPARRLALHLRRNQHILVDADPALTSQVLTNLLDNARKYSPEDRPVDVYVEVTGHMVHVSVRDHGPGLPLEEQARIWDCFYQAPGMRYQPSHGPGLGLGLYVTRLIIGQQGGDVGVKSKPGHGAAFWFTLPLADAPHEQPAAAG